MIPERFWQPWKEIDPSGAHGGLAGELDEYVGARLGDNPATKNIDMLTVFSAVRDSAAAISMSPVANVEGPPGRAIVEETLRALNWCLERILDRTRTNATAFFQWCHATPPMVSFAQRPIRYPLRSDYANAVIYHFLGELVEIAENNANALHAAMDPSACQRLLAPLLHLKGNIMRDWFDVEVAGEITLAELSTIFEGLARPGPTIVPPGETHPTPTGEQVSGVLTGADLIQWYPSPEEWTVFSRKVVEIYKPERLWQPEGAGAATEDIAPETPVRPTPIRPG